MIRCLDSIVIEEDNAMVSIDEGLVSANVYFRDTIPHTKQHEVISALANFLSQLFMVSSEDMNLLNALLICPLEELGNTLTAHNRLLPDEQNIPDEQIGSDEMDFETLELVEQQQRENLDPSTQSLRVQAQAQYTLHKFIPSFQARSQHISNSAKSFRITKPLTQHASVRERIRSERLQQHLLSIQSSISELPSPSAQDTLADHSGQMKVFLQEAGLNLSSEWSGSTTYHLEVKTTAGSCSEPFFVSQNQVNMMKRFDNDPNNAYVPIRVFDIDADSPGLKFYPRPWNLSLQGTLEYASAAKKGNYYDPIEDALAAAKKGICADRRHVNDSLFYCLHGTNGDIKYKAFCSKGCSNNGIGKSDSC
ncbi:hypothetical protein FALBO_15799 [Fusarium albosuccineum]|uniref:Uncharacterized protein n=1 Tax=Fusarium albosuccineum TaxID=1237068 RepID=A0A8H4KNL9_9HYPO|nr:hypothetical protein FALBO_15799 [Fusarium albosuccineum]